MNTFRQTSVKRSVITLVILAAVAAGFIACHKNAGNSSLRRLQPISLRLSWIPNVEFAGILLAKEHGFYKDAGIDLRIEPGGMGLDPVQLVAGGADDIGIAEGSQIIIGRAKNIQLLAVGALYQKSPFGYITLKDSGITSVKDFRGRRIGTQPPFTFVLQTMLAANGMTLDDVQVTPVGFDVRPLTEKNVDAFLSFVTNEPILLGLKGINTNVIPASDNGYHFYSDVIFTKADYANQHSDLLRNFLAATIRGWQAAIDDPEAAVQVVIQQYSKDLQPQHQRAALRLNIDMITAGVGREGIGKMTESTWSEGVQTLFRYKQIDHSVDVSQLYTNEFLPK